MANVNLEDVLAGQHLSPFTLGEFEDHLVNVQHSAENLYFYFWLSDYTEQYREWQASANDRKNSTTSPIPLDNLPSSSGPSTGRIQDSLSPINEGAARSVPAFLRHALVSKCQGETTSRSQVDDVPLSPIPQGLSKAPIPEELLNSFESLRSLIIPPRQSHHALHDFGFELNISQQLKDQFRLRSEHSMAPEIFTAIKKEVMSMLSDSMHSWLRDCGGNSDRHRARLTLCIGAVCVSLAVAGTVILMITTTRGEIRLCLSPLVWIGLEIFFCGLFRTCPLIFMFGSFRQIHFWELGRAEEAAALTKKNMLSKRHDFLINQKAGSRNDSFTLPGAQRAPRLSDSGSLRKFWDSGHQFKTSDELIIYGPADRNSRHVSISISYPTRQDTKASNLTKLISPSSSTGKQTPQKQARLIPSNSSSAPILGPLTEVLSPVAIRSHRINILKSVVLATLFTALWVVLCLLVHSEYIHS
ncbi:hypothetical protein MJO28_015256 [Puccinia striiformis f. sp. tritici]|uniref:Uncharacterized protein n=1 Tax=Puccinia striiformis f. sp. tritici TaxID=168172 RepID=A0ACC0DT90_9BASI|nr:hypothetical protein Pst134EB_028620 [Puccinia striiformis f. sp. tritici]KAI7937711.1 hypothetical protein MJO29_015026 [Puccinia striiformis f. sp. tritici]KAI7938336.1 hypothetical protein MJO28_015256 [Puccinia striiformis f. sp. tritici]KAI9607774.1 hypothetical protein H4Q26_005219 [Puccinia striiformis f. sp. tritici PST-130]